MKEISFWILYGLEPFAIAAKLYAEYGGDGGKPKRKRKTIKPKGYGRKIPSRPFGKQRGFQ
jgi:hypothetical protein